MKYKDLFSSLSPPSQNKEQHIDEAVSRKLESTFAAVLPRFATRKFYARELFLNLLVDHTIPHKNS